MIQHGSTITVIGQITSIREISSADRSKCIARINYEKHLGGQLQYAATVSAIAVGRIADYIKTMRPGDCIAVVGELAKNESDTDATMHVRQYIGIDPTANARRAREAQATYTKD